MKTILVTGGHGLVGTAIQSVVSKESSDYTFVFISSKDYDLCDFNQAKHMFDTFKPNYVIHLAACVGGLFKNMSSKVEMLEKNLLLNYNVVKLSHDYKVTKMIACLSTCIFPDNVEYPITEDALHNGPPHPSNETYAYVKRMLEIHCRSYRENLGDDFVCITPTNIYGPNDNFDLKNGHVLPSLIHQCYLAMKRNLPFVVKGTGKPLRQFIFSEDLAKLILIILFEKNSSEHLILSVDEKDEVSIGDLASIIVQKMKFNGEMLFDASFSDGQYKKTTSNRKLRKWLEQSEHGTHFEFTPIEQGLEKTIDWFLHNVSIGNVREK